MRTKYGYDKLGRNIGTKCGRTMIESLILSGMRNGNIVLNRIGGWFRIPVMELGIES